MSGTNLSLVVSGIHPAANATSVLLADTVWALFTQEIDEHSIWEGNFIIYGPDNNTVVGPGAALELPFTNPNTQSALTGTTQDGIVPGSFTFQRIDLNDLLVSSAVDVVGSGLLYRTLATFTPTVQWPPSTLFTTYLSGNPDGTTRPGIKPRSIFDPVFTGTGSKNLTLIGTYENTGIPTDTLNITIVASGVAGVATCTWFYTSAPATIYGPILIPTGQVSFSTTADSDNGIDFSNGVHGYFGAGTFVAGDKFTVKLIQQNSFIGSFDWLFTTGTQSILTIPTSTATSVIGDLVPVTIPSPQFGFTMNPWDKSSNLNPTPITQILLNFATPLNTATVTSDNILIMGNPTNGDPTLLAPREIYKSIVVTSGLNGGTLLTMNIQ